MTNKSFKRAIKIDEELTKLEKMSDIIRTTDLNNLGVINTNSLNCIDLENTSDIFKNAFKEAMVNTIKTEISRLREEIKNL